MRVGASFLSILVASLACGPPPCPRDMELFVPTENPEDVLDQGDTDNMIRCGDEWLENDLRGSHFRMTCSCGVCPGDYVGNEYCVPMVSVRSWLSRSCPGCRVDYHDGYDDIVTVSIECSAVGCDDD